MKITHFRYTLANAADVADRTAYINIKDKSGNQIGIIGANGTAWTANQTGYLDMAYTQVGDDTVVAQASGVLYASVTVMKDIILYPLMKFCVNVTNGVAGDTQTLVLGYQKVPINETFPNQGS